MASSNLFNYANANPINRLASEDLEFNSIAISKETVHWVYISNWYKTWPYAI